MYNFIAYVVIDTWKWKYNNKSWSKI